MNTEVFSEENVAAFLSGFDAPTIRRGEQYFTQRAVVDLQVEEPGLRYKATVVGSAMYEVTLAFDPADRMWDSECTCPVACYCKHAYAAMLALRANVDVLAKTTPQKKKRGRTNGNGNGSNMPRLFFAPQPASSPLSNAIAQGLGRLLAEEESRYVKMVQNGFREFRTRPLHEGDLAAFSPDLQPYGWRVLELWPDVEPPRTDLEFWEYIAYELRVRNVRFPRCMLPATNTGRVERVMKAFQAQKEIARWRENLRRQRPEPISGDADCRVMIRGTRAFLQLKKPRDSDFSDISNRQQRQYAYGQSDAAADLMPDAYLLWSMLEAGDNCESSGWKLEDEFIRAALGRVLRVPLLASRVVGLDGQPLKRPAEALSYRLEEPGPNNADYVLKLVLPTGEAAPRIKGVFDGSPTLYLTDDTIYSGPPAHKLGLSEAITIPVGAIESRAGLEFLQRAHLPAPSRISARVRNLAPKLTIQCCLNRSQAREQVVLKVASRLGNTEETCGANGWHMPQSRAYPAYSATPAPSFPEVNEDGSIPIIDTSLKNLFPGILEPLKAKWEPYFGDWRISVGKPFPERFASWLKTIPPQVEVLLDKELGTLRDGPISGSVELNIEEAGVDWFDLRVALKVTDLQLTKEELKLLLNARGGFVRLGGKGWRRLQFNLSHEENERLAQLGLHPGDFSAEPQRLHALQLANPAARHLLPEAEVESIERRASEIKTRVSPPVPEGISATLRPYQLDGFHFLCYLSANRFGGVLADDMGLGKTVQALTWLSHLRGNGSSGPPQMDKASLPSLIICPKSVMDNWKSEAARFYSGLRVRLWNGDEAGRIEPVRSECDLVVINYAQLRSLSPTIASYQWQAVILDEAQYTKNPDSQTAQAARALKANHRLALTGTPIENRLLDLWSILSFAMPGVLGNRSQFLKNFNQQNDPLARRRLAARVRPFLLRRTKAQVARDLPDKIEEDIICELEGRQKTLYRAEFKAAQQKLLSISTQKELNEQRFNFLTSLLRLRQICCHPALVDGMLIDAESAKVNALLGMIESIIEEGHKVLVFSQFVTMLDLLKPQIEERQWKYFYLTGETENRGELVSQFQAHDGGAVFLISLKAGGFGLNLTAASYVFIFDPWWNPAVENQAIDRTHRIGQTSKVNAYRLLVKDSIEQKIRALQKSKAALADDVLGEERFSQSLTLDDLRFLFED